MPPPPARASCHSTARLLLPACHPPPLPILKDCAGSMDAGRCPGDCCGNGLCLDGVCECQDGFGPRLLEDSSSGVNDCCQRVCPDDCGSAAGHGLCDAQVGRCVCAVGWSGASCDEPACPRGCTAHGMCNATSGQCACDAGWAGADCGRRLCPNGCGAHGLCEAGECRCIDGFTGPSCQLRRCPSDCSGNGRCRQALNGGAECMCEAGYAGPDCSRRACPDRCSQHGVCNWELRCECGPGWSGKNCATPTCLGDCRAQSRAREHREPQRGAKWPKSDKN